MFFFSNYKYANGTKLRCHTGQIKQSESILMEITLRNLSQHFITVTLHSLLASTETELKKTGIKILHRTSC